MRESYVRDLRRGGHHLSRLLAAELAGRTLYHRPELYIDGGVAEQAPISRGLALASW